MYIYIYIYIHVYMYLVYKYIYIYILFVFFWTPNPEPKTLKFIESFEIISYMGCMEDLLLQKGCLKAYATFCHCGFLKDLIYELILFAFYVFWITTWLAGLAGLAWLAGLAGWLAGWLEAGGTRCQLQRDPGGTRPGSR